MENGVRVIVVVDGEPREAVLDKEQQRDILDYLLAEADAGLVLRGAPVAQERQESDVTRGCVVCPCCGHRKQPHEAFCYACAAMRSKTREG